MSFFRTFLRRFEIWIKFRDLFREGLSNALKRMFIQRKILFTKPIATNNTGEIEVRILTWRRDIVNLLWALKSFYRKNNVQYPLYIHDGGLNQFSVDLLKKHFPNCHIIFKEEADKIVEEYFKEHAATRCAEYRKSNIATRKLFDFFILSKAKRIISIDSDIVFFGPTKELTAKEIKRNLYNKDGIFAYSISLEKIKNHFQLNLGPYFNSGLFNVARDIFNIQKLEEWLNDEELFNNKWVTEQTLHAMLSAYHIDGAELLPESYMVSTKPGIIPTAVCKHYPGYFRPLFYQEGMQKLKDEGFLSE